MSLDMRTQHICFCITTHHFTRMYTQHFDRSIQLASQHSTPFARYTFPSRFRFHCGLMKLCRRYKSVIAKRPVHLNSKTVHLFQTRVGVIWSTDVFVECVQLGPQSFPVRGAAEVVLPGLACNVMRPLLPGGSRRNVLSRCTHKCTII